MAHPQWTIRYYAGDKEVFAQNVTGRTKDDVLLQGQRMIANEGVVTLDRGNKTFVIFMSKVTHFSVELKVQPTRTDAGEEERRVREEEADVPADTYMEQ